MGKNGRVFTDAEKNIIFDMLKRMFIADIELIGEERDEKGMEQDDPEREYVSLRLKEFSVPFGIPLAIQSQLKDFFKEKGWEFIRITSSPSIKLKRISNQNEKENGE